MVRVATTAKYPSSLLTLADVGLFTNREDCSLVTDATSGASTLYMDDVTQIAVGMWISSLSEDGFEIVRVTAVDLGLATATVARAQDGTVAVAHKQGQTWKAVIPAVALNQLRDDVIAHAAFLTPSGGAWTTGSVLFIGATGNLEQDNASLFFDNTNNILKSKTHNPFADNTYDLGTSALRWRALYVGPSSIHVVNAASDANDIARLNASLSMGAGGASALDTFLWRQAASTFAVGSSAALINGTVYTDTLKLKNNNAGTDVTVRIIGGAQAAAFAGSVIPASDNTFSAGFSSNRWSNVASRTVSIYSTVSDANAVVDLSTLGVDFGPGGASALDTLLSRQQSSMLILTGTVAGSVRFGMTGAGNAHVALRAAVADANPYYQVDSTGLAFGAGGASATDLLLARSSASILTLTGNLAGNIRMGMGSAGIPAFTMRTAVADVNPTLRLGVDTGFSMAVSGGATAADVFLARNAASVWQVTGSLAGDARLGMSGAGTSFLSLRLATADAQPAVRIGTDLGLQFGAGGASAMDWQLSRTGANAAAVAAGNTFAITDMTTGSVPFIAASGVFAQDNANLFWDNAAKRLGIGTAAPSTGLHALKATAGTANTVFVEHSDNTNATSNARLLLQVGGGSGGDPFTSYAVSGVTTWSQGIDNSDSDAFVLSLNATIGTSNRVRFLTDGTQYQWLGASAGDVRLGIASAAAPYLSLRLASADAQPAFNLTFDTIAFGAGGASATDIALSRAAADRLNLASGDTLRIATDGSGGSLQFGASGDVRLYRSAAGAIATQTGTAGDGAIVNSVGAGSLAATAYYKASTDANASMVIGAITPSIQFGSGGASALDATFARTAAATLKITSILALNNLGGGADPLLSSNSSSQVMRITGSFVPTTDNSVSNGFSSNRWSSMASLTYDVYAAVSDANAVVGLRTTGIVLGAGGATATDILLARSSSSVIAHTGALAGDVRIGLLTAAQPVVSGRLAAADAQPIWRLNVVSSQPALEFGAGGATAADVFHDRQTGAANKYHHFGAAAAGTTGVWIDVTTPGIVLKDAAGSPHYWRVTIDTAGALVTTDLGTSLT